MRKSKREIDEYIGSRIREARLSLHLSQELLAKALGISFQQVQNYEKGMNIDAQGKQQKVSIRATNVFHKEDGKWKMIGHHTDQLSYLKD